MDLGNCILGHCIFIKWGLLPQFPHPIARHPHASVRFTWGPHRGRGGPLEGTPLRPSGALALRCPGSPCTLTTARPRPSRDMDGVAWMGWGGMDGVDGQEAAPKPCPHPTPIRTKTASITSIRTASMERRGGGRTAGVVRAAHLGLQEGVLQEAALKPCPHPTPAPPMKRQHGEAGRGGTAGVALGRRYTKERDGGCPRLSESVVWVVHLVLQGGVLQKAAPKSCPYPTPIRIRTASMRTTSRREAGAGGGRRGGDRR